MYVRIVGDAGAVVVDLTERVGIGSGLGILHVGRNRELPGSSIGCCRADFLSCAVFQQEVEVPSALLRCAVLKQGFGAGNVQRRGGCHNFLFPAKNQTAVGHDAAAVDVGMVAGDNHSGSTLRRGNGLRIRVCGKAKEVIGCGIAGFADCDVCSVTGTSPVRRAVTQHLTSNQRNRVVATAAHAEIVLVSVGGKGAVGLGDC